MVTVLNLDNCTHTLMDFPKKRSAFAPKEQDPMSHRIIEKRRRDRMNNCLADLSRLIPPDYLKKGRGRIEKTEIIEMAIKHLKYLQERANLAERHGNGAITPEHFRLGYQECLSEVMRYLVKGQAHFSGDAMCVQLINHLQRHCDNILKGDVLNRVRPDSNSSSSGSSSNYTTHKLSTLNNIQRNANKSLDINNEEKAYLSYEIDHARRTSASIDGSVKEISNEEQEYNNQKMSPESLVTSNEYSGTSPVEDNGDEGGEWNRSNFLRKSIQLITENPKSDNQSIQDIQMYNHFPILPPNYNYGQHHSNVQKINGTPLDDSGLSLNSGQEVDNVHSYKFKNTIKQRFSQSQSNDYLSSSHSDGTVNMYNWSENPITKWEHYNSSGKVNHKKRKMESRHFNNTYSNTQFKDNMSSSETTSSENLTTVSQNQTYRSNMMKETSASNRQSAEKEYSKLGHTGMNNRHGKLCSTNEKAEGFINTSGLGVPIFALHAKGTFYVPMNVDYDSLIPFLGQYNLLETTTLQSNSSLHPVTISVNFQPKFINNKQTLTRNKTEYKEWH